MDCYILGSGDYRSGSILECEPIGLLEQWEAGEPDHKVLAVLAGEDETLPAGILDILQDFIYGVFSEFPDYRVSVGPVRPKANAVAYLEIFLEA